MQLSTIFLFLFVPFHFLFNKYINHKTKLFIVPVILFYLPAAFIISTLSVYTGSESFFTTYLLMILTCSAIIILFSLLRIGDNLNSVDKAFLYFWLYFILISVLLDDSWMIVINKLVMIIIFLSGMQCGKFIVQNRLELKAFNYLSISGLLCSYLYFKIYLPDLDTGLPYFQSELLKTLEAFNPNHAAGLCLPFVVSGLISAFIIPNKLTFRVIGFSSFASNFYLIFSIGSRNSFFAALLCLIVVTLYNTKNSKKILLLPLIAIFFIAVGHYPSIFIDSRIVNTILEPGVRQLSGREQIWIYFLNQMNMTDYIFGSGSAIEPSSGLWSNMHSMYIQIFYESGIIGSILFLLFIGKYFFCAVRMGKIEFVPLSIFAIVLVVAVAESDPLRGFSIINFLWGMSVGLLSPTASFPATDGETRSTPLPELSREAI